MGEVDQERYSLGGLDRGGEIRKRKGKRQVKETHRLWHYHLVHMGDRGMKELSKHGLIIDIDGDISEVCDICQMKK